MENNIIKLGEITENLTNKELMDIFQYFFNIYIVVIANAKEDIVEVNERFLNTFHYSSDEIGEINMNGIIKEYEKLYFHQMVKEDIKRQKYWSGQLRLKDKANQHIDAMVHIIEWKNSSEWGRNLLYLISPLPSVSEYERMRELAYTDELTGLPNMRKFQASISFQMKKSAKQKSKFALLFIDIDDFKKINDQYGHIIGDQFLKESASRLKDTLANNHFLFRKSGDEFIIIVEDVERLDEIQDDILKQFMKKFQIGHCRFNVHISIGVGIYPDHGRNLESLLHFADRAMYENKRKNKEWKIFRK